jgi:hypothetical protein
VEGHGKEMKKLRWKRGDFLDDGWGWGVEDVH